MKISHEIKTNYDYYRDVATGLDYRGYKLTIWPENSTIKCTLGNNGLREISFINIKDEEIKIILTKDNAIALLSRLFNALIG